MITLDELINFVGQRLRGLRKAKGWTQEKFAEESGHQASYIAGVERGERNITLDTLEKLLLVLEVKPATFFSVSEEDNLLENLKAHVSLLSTRSHSEVELINKISQEIFETIDSQIKK